jgi:hypothetical protein
MVIRKPSSVVVYVAENWNSQISFGENHKYQILKISVKLFIR